MCTKTTETFVSELTEKDVVGHTQKSVYRRYVQWCKERKCYCYKLTGLTHSLKKSFGVVTVRRRLNGILVSFYEKED